MLRDVDDVGGQEYQRSAVVTRVGVVLSPLLPLVTIATVVMSRHRQSLSVVFTWQVLTGAVWGGLMTLFTRRYAARRIAAALPVPLSATRRDDAAARSKTATGHLVVAGIWCPLLLVLGPDNAVAGYAYAVPVVAAILHHQVVDWERTHNATLWWRTGFAARGRHYFIG